MGTFGHTRALRAALYARALLALALASLGPATDGRAGVLDGTKAAQASLPPGEPFGLGAMRINFGGLRDKWLAVQRRLDDERVQLALCDGDRERCASPAALQFLAIVDAARERDGRAGLGEVNRAVNLAIRPMSDLAQYGEIDVWNSPLVTFFRGAGDCEDYAIAKYMALRAAGLAEADLRIVVLHDTMLDEDHAVAAVRLDGRWLLLDNRRMAMIEDVQIKHYRPLFVIDQSGVMQYQDAPLAVATPERGFTVSAVPALAAQPEPAEPSAN